MMCQECGRKLDKTIAALGAKTCANCKIAAMSDEQIRRLWSALTKPTKEDS